MKTLFSLNYKSTNILKELYLTEKLSRIHSGHIDQILKDFIIYITDISRMERRSVKMHVISLIKHNFYERINKLISGENTEHREMVKGLTREIIDDIATDVRCTFIPKASFSKKEIKRLKLS